MGRLCRGIVPLLAWCCVAFQEGKGGSCFPWGTQISFARAQPSRGSQPNLGSGGCGVCIKPFSSHFTSAQPPRQTQLPRWHRVLHHRSR